ncbi:MAG: hypothetical protein Q4F84_09165, partial [Fibrobacter sp.]|nr:hypothetical protein [Fibrobacter sp.]
LKFPKGFCNAVGKCLQLEPNKRYSDTAYFDTDLMAVFKRLTKKTPEEVIQAYLDKPDVLSPVIFKNFNFKKAVSSCFKLLGITLLIWCVGVFALKAVKTYYFDKLSSNVPQPVVKTQPDTLASKPVDTVQAVPQKPKQPPLSPYEKATKAFDNSDYKTAAQLFEKLPTDQLSEKQKNLRVIKMMQSHIKLDDFKKVISIANSETCTDARFYLLSGEAYHKMGNFDDALQVLKQAYKAKFRSTGTLSKVALLEAQVSESIYTTKPNKINRRLCYDLWSAYLQNYCSGKRTSTCKEAQSKIAIYE